MLRFSRATSTLLVPILLILAAAPAVAGPTQCLNLAVQNVGDGLGVYALTDAAAAVGLQVASGVPQDGMTFSVLIVPSLCTGTDVPDERLPLPDAFATVSSVSDETDGLPLIP